MARKHGPGFLALVDRAKARVPEVSAVMAMEMVKRGDALTFVDTREEREWAAGHIDGAIHLSKGIIERDIETEIPDKEAVLVLYCGGGYRSALATDALHQMGYLRSVSMAGGWRAWNALD